MRILAHIHTFNAEDVIDRSLQALLDQSHPLDELLIVDNGSTDATLKRSFPAKVTVIRNPENCGPSGAVLTGLDYAMRNGYDWIWVLDADSIARPDALEKLVALHQTLHDTAHIGVLSSCVEPVGTRQPVDYCRLTPKGPKPVTTDTDRDHCDCDVTIWSGSLFSLQAVRKVGHPNCGRGYWEDFSFDFGDVEFCYRLRRAGYRIVIHKSSIIEHSLGRPTQRSLLGKRIFTSNHAAFRRYLNYRNMVYFFLYVYADRNTFFMPCYLVSQLGITTAKILLMEEDRLPKVRACLRGAWDGLRGNMRRRYIEG